MSNRCVDSSSAGRRRSSRLGALALAALMLVTACTTAAPMSGGPPAYRDDEAVFATLPTNFAPVQVSDSDLTNTLTTLWLHIPLRVASSHVPLYPGRELAQASVPLGGDEWRSDLARSYGRFCVRCGTPGDCLTLFEDGPRFQDDDKRTLALALAVGPALEGVSAEVRAMLNPTRVLATLSVTLVVYMGLLLAPEPEPVTKGLAVAFTVLMWGYLGWEFFDLLRAYEQLYDEAPQASTFEQLREIGERFARVIGPNSVRILVMVGTAAIGETVALASKAPKLPGFGQAAGRVELETGMRLLDAATGAERVIVSVPEGTLRIVLAPHVVAMVARGVPTGNPAPSRGKLLPNGHRAWGSYSGFKSAMGSAGKGKQWHHLVEQTPGNVKRFGGEALHNTENITALDEALHTRLSAFYSSKFLRVTSSRTLTIRQWLSTQSYEAQREFGLLAIENIKNGIWP